MENKIDGKRVLLRKSFIRLMLSSSFGSIYIIFIISFINLIITALRHDIRTPFTFLSVLHNFQNIYYFIILGLAFLLIVIDAVISSMFDYIEYDIKNRIVFSKTLFTQKHFTDIVSVDFHEIPFLLSTTIIFTNKSGERLRFYQFNDTLSAKKIMNSFSNVN